MHLYEFNVLPSITTIFLSKKLDSYEIEISFNIVLFADKVVRQNVILHICVFCLQHQAELFFTLI